MNSKDVIKIIEADGWIEKNTKGSHHHFIHPLGTVDSILKQASLK